MRSVCIDGMASWLKVNSGVDVMVAVPAPYLAWCTERRPNGLYVLAQNVVPRLWGAHRRYTAEMLKSCNVDGAIVGHSERRARFGDEDVVVAAKVDALIASISWPSFVAARRCKSVKAVGQRTWCSSNCRPRSCACLSTK